MYSVTQSSDMPNEPHWAILTYSSIYIPGDERSRTNPGHGYPASTERVVTYKPFFDEEEWKEEVRELERRGTSYSAMQVIPATVTTDVRVNIE